MTASAPDPQPSKQPAGSQKLASSLGSAMRSRHVRGLMLAVLAGASLGGLLLWQRLRPVAVAVGVDRPLVT